MKRIVALAILVLVTISLLSLSAGAKAAEPEGRVLLIGIPSLRWPDIKAHRAPTLQKLAADSALGVLSARTIGRATCAGDGWATISSGRRAAVGGLCRQPVNLVPEGRGARVMDVSKIGQYNTDLGFPSHVGLLGDAVHKAGKCVSAVGPGAALAGADSTGRVDLYAASPATASAEAWTRCPVTIADLDDLVRPVLDGTRTEVLRRIDAVVAQILAATPAGTTIVVAGISDNWKARLRAAMVSGPGFTHRSLGSDSTRQSNLVILPDLTATLLDVTKIPAPETLVGAPVRSSGGPQSGLRAEVRRLTIQAAEPEVLKVAGPQFYPKFMISQLVLYALGVLALWFRGFLLPVIRVAALSAAALPVSVFLVNLMPWTGETLLVKVLLCDLLLTGLALAGPWRRSALGPVFVVAGVSAATLALDQFFGGPLQVNSLMGNSQLGGWRYYGIGNMGFAALVVSTLLASSVAAQWLHDRGRPRAAVAVVLVLCLTTAALDGLTAWGSDFGGMIAFIPGLAATALLISGRRISLLKLGLLSIGATAVVLGVSFLDHLRPADEQSHLGRFIGDALNGQGTPVVARKITAMVQSFSNPYLTPIMIAAALFLVLALLRPWRPATAPLRQVYADAPFLRSGLIGVIITLVLGAVVNDSGVSIPAIGLTVAVPLALAASAQTLRLNSRAQERTEPVAEHRPKVSSPLAP